MSQVMESDIVNSSQENANYSARRNHLHGAHMSFMISTPSQEHQTMTDSFDHIKTGGNIEIQDEQPKQSLHQAQRYQQDFAGRLQLEERIVIDKKNLNRKIALRK